MKLIVFACLVAASVAAPQNYDEYGNIIKYDEPEIKLVSERNVQDGKGNYEYGYELSNGQKVEEVGKSYPGYEPETGSISKEGYFQYVSPEGKQVRVDYVADDEGFKPKGDVLPVAPPQLPEYAELKAQFPELY